MALTQILAIVLDQVEGIEDRGWSGLSAGQFAIQARETGHDCRGAETVAGGLHRQPPRQSLGPTSSRWLRRLGSKLQTVLP
jgi:hypothetical protein